MKIAQLPMRELPNYYILELSICFRKKRTSECHYLWRKLTSATSFKIPRPSMNRTLWTYLLLVTKSCSFLLDCKTFTLIFLTAVLWLLSGTATLIVMIPPIRQITSSSIEGWKRSNTNSLSPRSKTVLTNIKLLRYVVTDFHLILVFWFRIMTHTPRQIWTKDPRTDSFSNDVGIFVLKNDQGSSSLRPECLS